LYTTLQDGSHTDKNWVYISVYFGMGSASNFHYKDQIGYSYWLENISYQSIGKMPYQCNISTIYNPSFGFFGKKQAYGMVQE